MPSKTGKVVKIQKLKPRFPVLPLYLDNNMKSNLFKRIISGLILMGTLIPIIIFSSKILIALMMIASLVALYEYGLLTEIKKGHLVAGIIWGAILWGSVLADFHPVSFASLTVPVIGLLVLLDKTAVTTGLTTISLWSIGILYCVVPFVFAYLAFFQSGHPYDWRLPLGIVMINYMSDTLAYFSGKYLGKHLFSPSISPKKTWEGVAGGFTGAWIMGIGMLYFAGEVHWNWLILSAIISIFNQPGDLIESVIKRSVNKKDSGNLIPGHGGILDRVDSLLTIFPIIYFYQTFT